MDVLPLHPKLVHLPIALALVMPLLSAGLLLAWMRGLLPRATWVVAVGLQALLMGSGIAALRSGANDEARVERVVSEARIEAHEEAAEFFVGAAGGVLALAILAFALRPETLARSLAALTAAGTVAVLALGYRTGEAGGRLVYQYGAASAFTTRSPANAPAAPVHGDDD